MSEKTVVPQGACALGSLTSKKVHFIIESGKDVDAIGGELMD